MDYKNDPLWKQAVEMQTEACKHLFGVADASYFDTFHKDLANVVLAYFDGKTTEEMILFANSLRKVARGCGNSAAFSYKCNADADEAYRYTSLAEKCVEELWAKQHGELKKDTDNGKDGEEKLNVFERILNRCVLFLKGK